jgi:hypothetical protein
MIYLKALLIFSIIVAISPAIVVCAVAGWVIYKLMGY